MLLNNVTIMETLKNDESAKHRNEQKALSDDAKNSKISKSSMENDSEFVTDKRIAKGGGEEFFSRFIIGNNGRKDEPWSDTSENHPRDEKSEEETQGKYPLTENNETHYEKSGTKLPKHEKYILSSMDTLLSIVMTGPSVIGFWRGTWGLMDLYWDMFPFWLCFTFGIATHIMFGFTKYQLYDYINEIKSKSLLNRIACQCLRITYTYTFGVICNMHWRGGWIILDEYLHMKELWITASLTTSFFGALITLRCIRNLLAPPFVVAIDSYSHLFYFPSICKQVSTN